MWIARHGRRCWAIDVQEWILDYQELIEALLPMLQARASTNLFGVFISMSAMIALESAQKGECEGQMPLTLPFSDSFLERVDCPCRYNGKHC